METADRSTLRPFFETFEASNAAGDAAALAQRYAPALMVAGPAGARVVHIADLLLAIPKRRQLFDTAGRQSTTLSTITETALDDRYTLVNTAWTWRFRSTDGNAAELTLPSTFIVERSSDGPRIIFYLMHHDIAAVLRERGLLPSSDG